MPAAVSIILPTYNRARFLPQAFASIKAQQFIDWELIVVDDGSTDDSREIIEREFTDIEQPVIYIRQENQGAYGARNTGLDHATGKYIAFFDSDDEWLPHHLRDCIEALEANADVDWVYGACRIVDDATGEVREESTFYVDGKPRRFLKLAKRNSGGLAIIDNKSLRKALFRIPLYCGLQNSVHRRDTFASQRFESLSRNEAEDSLFAVRCILGGATAGFFNSVHVNYHAHSSHASAAFCSNAEKVARLIQLKIDGVNSIDKSSFSFSERLAFRGMISRLYFWKLGYSTLWQAGEHDRAMSAFRKGIRSAPWDCLLWKTFALSAMRRCIARIL